MSTFENLQTIGSLNASADLSAKQYTLVKVSGVNTIASNVLATTLSIGILLNEPPSGSPGTVAIAGVTKAKCGAAVTAGDQLMSDTSGRVITATGSGAYVIGVALETSANADEIIRILLLPLRLIP
jgi:hypothetical protein